MSPNGQCGVNKTVASHASRQLLSDCTDAYGGLLALVGHQCARARSSLIELASIDTLAFEQFWL